MNLGHFQFRNLLKTPVNYVLLDFREPLRETEEKFARAVFVTQATYEKTVDEAVRGDLSLPVIVICRDGALSAHIASALEKKGHINVFHVENGVSEAKRKL